MKRKVLFVGGILVVVVGVALVFALARPPAVPVPVAVEIEIERIVEVEVEKTVEVEKIVEVEVERIVEVEVEKIVEVEVERIVEKIVEVEVAPPLVEGGYWNPGTEFYDLLEVSGIVLEKGLQDPFVVFFRLNGALDSIWVWEGSFGETLSEEGQAEFERRLKKAGTPNMLIMMLDSDNPHVLRALDKMEIRWRSAPIIGE